MFGFGRNKSRKDLLVKYDVALPSRPWAWFLSIIHLIFFGVTIAISLIIFVWVVLIVFSPTSSRFDEYGYYVDPFEALDAWIPSLAMGIVSSLFIAIGFKMSEWARVYDKYYRVVRQGKITFMGIDGYNNHYVLIEGNTYANEKREYRRNLRPKAWLNDYEEGDYISFL